MSGNKREKISIRITPHQSLVLQEMSQVFGTSYSMLCRTIIGDWLTTHEDYLYQIIDKKKGYANNQFTAEEEEDYTEEGYRYEETQTESLSEQELEKIERYLLKGAPDMRGVSEEGQGDTGR
jgi:hypothetical protein